MTAPAPTANEGDPVRLACGHTAPCPPDMGRGAARRRRIAEWARQHCRHCAVDGALSQAEREIRSLDSIRAKRGRQALSAIECGRVRERAVERTARNPERRPVEQPGRAAVEAAP